MKTKAAVLYGKKDIRVEEITLPPISPDELLVKIISNSLCMSTLKCATLGSEHKRVPDTIATKPVIVGHEFASFVIEVGDNLKDRYKVNDKILLQPALGLSNGYSPGYSFQFFGGDAEYCIIPKIAIDNGCAMDYQGEFFANASLAEPTSCVLGAMHASYHTKEFVYKHDMGIKAGGKIALLASTGAMGLMAIDLCINGEMKSQYGDSVPKPSLLVVTDINQERLDRAATLLSPEMAKKKGIELHYLNTSSADAVEKLMALSGGTGYDDVFTFVPFAPVLEQADQILGYDGCHNSFAGPVDKNCSALLNYYHVHYSSHHVVGTSGGSPEDMQQCVDLSVNGDVNPCFMVTHICGLEAVPEGILTDLASGKNGKMLCYTHTDLPMVALSDFTKLGQSDDKYKDLYQKLGSICDKNNHIWNLEAEKALLEYFNITTSV
ncbi:MAG: zinc-binding dehydrogenase [Eubacteriales bacterium]